MKFIKIFSIILLAGIIIGGALSVGIKLQSKQTIKLQASLPNLTRYDLENDSDLIIEGTVKDISKPKWSDPDHKKYQLERYVYIDANQFFKGTDSKSIKVKTFGGELDNIIVEDESAAKFEKNKKVILFLSKGKEGLQDYYVVNGESLGKFDVSENNDFVCSLSKEKINKGTFQKEIDDALAKEKANPRPKLTDEEIAVRNEKAFGK